MAWQDAADLRTNSPAVTVTIDFDSGMRYYSPAWLHLAKQYKGKVLSLPNISGSVGDIKRTFQRGKITIVFDDTDYEFRSLIETESPGFKNREVVISVYLEEDDSSLAVYTGQVYDWRFLDGLKFELSVEEKSINLENKYPEYKVSLSDYPSAHESCLSQVVPVVYGSISALGLSGNGAFGWPGLANATGLAFVDTTNNAEKHLVGRQNSAITVNRVYIDGVLKTLTTDYTVSSAVVAGKTHTLIDWVSGVNPTETSFVTADIFYSTAGPVEAIYHFLTSFCGHVAGDFNAASKTAAMAIESDRGYEFSGALWQEEPLKTILDKWRDEFELDIYWNKAGERCWNYLTSAYSTPTEYNDLLHFLRGFDRDPQVTKIINKLDYGYQFHYAKTYYYAQATYQDTASQTKHGGTFRDFKGFRWIRTAATAVDIASRKIIRFKDPITFEKYLLPLPAFSGGLTDMIKATHFGGIGSAGHAGRLCQVRGERYDLNRFVKEVMVEDASNFAGAAFILGDSVAMGANWGVASDADKEYGYLCSRATGEFTGGDAGKRLLD